MLRLLILKKKDNSCKEGSIAGGVAGALIDWKLDRGWWSRYYSFAFLTKTVVENAISK